jgi:hypothetical protein
LFLDGLFAAASGNDPHDQHEQLNPKLNVHPSSSLTMVAEHKSPMGDLSTPLFFGFSNVGL